MPQKAIKNFLDEIYSKPPKKNYVTIKTDVYHLYDNWSLGILDLKDYGSETNRGYRCFSSIRQFLKLCLDISYKKMLLQ